MTAKRARKAVAAPVALFHATTPEAAQAIMAGGFEDRENRNLRYGGLAPGVWLSTAPAIDDDLLGGWGGFDFDAERQAFVAITASRNWLAQYGTHWVDQTWKAGAQWHVPAQAVNALPRRLMSLDEALATRLRMPHLGMPQHALTLDDMRRWVSADRGYRMAFVMRVRAALAEIAA